MTIAPLSAATGAASNSSSAGGELEACQELARLLAELDALQARLTQIQLAIKELLIEIAAAAIKEDKTAIEQQSSGRKKTETAKREVTPRLTKCPPNCTGGATGKPKTDAKIAKPIAASGGGGGSRLLSPSLLDGGAGLSGGNTTVRGSPAGGMTSSPGPGRATVR